MHPKMYDTEYELRNVGISQRNDLNDHLNNFLDWGRFMLIKDKLQAWCKKMNVKPVQISRTDVSRINTWPKFIATLLDLVLKSS